MKLLKRNQVIVYSIAVLLMVAGYLNYSTNTKQTLETSSQEVNTSSELANVGDARLVSSSDITENTNVSTNNETNTTNSVNSTTNATNTNTNTTTETSTTAENKNDDYFAKSKLERDTMYSQMLETYENILNSSNSLETQKQSATEEIKKINDTKNSIMICENLIKTKGFENSIIFVNGESISIVVKDDQLTTEKVAQIQNIISREMNAKVENIHISNK